jgi:hypothetical protein
VDHGAKQIRMTNASLAVGEAPASIEVGAQVSTARYTGS